MYYTGKGDDGSSNILGPTDRISKGDSIFELLGSLDELNSYLGFCLLELDQKLTNLDQELTNKGEFLQLYKISKEIQQDLFICQAYVARAKIKIPTDIVKKVEKQISWISSQLNQRVGFVLSGGSKLSVLFDVARTLARRAERQVYRVETKVLNSFNPLLLAYLNRLSSLLYVMARFSNDLVGISEEHPHY